MKGVRLDVALRGSTPSHVLHPAPRFSSLINLKSAMDATGQTLMLLTLQFSIKSLDIILLLESV